MAGEGALHPIVASSDFTCRRRRLRRHRRRQISILIFGGAVAEGGGGVDVGTPQFEVSFLSNLDLSVMITMERARARGEEAIE